LKGLSSSSGPLGLSTSVTITTRVNITLFG
jgi:hypothetical protein